MNHKVEIKNKINKVEPLHKIYFAGDLFDQKHITGNFLLAQSIEKISNSAYKCILPQDWESSLKSAIDIRNKDIKSVMQADMILFNFDGTDLDSGTVVEFIIAKMLDIPTVLLRTDFRRGGYLFGDDWNLMVGGYPRCDIVKHSSIVMYNDLGLEKTHDTIAQSIIKAFEQVKEKQSLLNSYEEIFCAYKHVIKMCGSELDKIITPQLLNKIIDAKIKKGIYCLIKIEADKTNQTTYKTGCHENLK